MLRLTTAFTNAFGLVVFLGCLAVTGYLARSAQVIRYEIYQIPDLEEIGINHGILVDEIDYVLNSQKLSSICLEPNVTCDYEIGRSSVIFSVYIENRSRLPDDEILDQTTIAAERLGESLSEMPHLIECVSITESGSESIRALRLMSRDSELTQFLMAIFGREIAQKAVLFEELRSRCEQPTAISFISQAPVISRSLNRYWLLMLIGFSLAVALSVIFVLRRLDANSSR